MEEVTEDEEEAGPSRGAFLKEFGPTQKQAGRQRAESCVSLKSDWSMPQPPTFSPQPGPAYSLLADQADRQRPVSCVSLKSDWSMPQPPTFSPQPGPAFSLLADQADRQRPVSCVSLKSDWSMPQPPTFSPQPEPAYSLLESPVTVQTNSFSTSCCRPRSSSTQDQSGLISGYKRSLEQRYGHVSQGAETESRTPLTSIYADLYMVDCQSEELSAQHEERQLETLSRRIVHEDPIKCHDVFKPLPPAQNPIRAVLTVGVAGVGKTFSVMKFCLDWAQGSKNQELELVVPLSFRELNLVRKQRYSLLTLVHALHPSLKELTAHKLAHSKVLFICDGLDESRLPLDFDCEVISDVTQTSDVGKLLVNLIKGTLLPDALIWITSRPAAANLIPVSQVDRLTEVRGFTENQRKDYFRKRFPDSQLCERVLSHIRTSRSLHIMCQIPVFSWITATVLDHMLRIDQSGLLPQTLTDLYASFLLVQTQMKRKYSQESSGSELSPADCELLLKLGRLAFEHLEKGSIMFYKEDLQRVGLEETDTLVNSGLCTKIFKRESVIFDQSVYCFIHLSVQEFLAALYKYHQFNNKKMFVKLFELNPTLDDYLRKALGKSFRSPSGHLDLFVRFLHGLILESNQRLLGALLGPSQTHSKTKQKVINNLKKMNTKASPDRSINILHCLTELNDHSVHQQILALMESGGKSKEKLTEIQCTALAYMLQMSEEVLDELNLQKYKTSAEGHLRLMPAVRNCRKAVLNSCGLSDASCSSLASALKSNPSHLRELDVRRNWDLKDSGLDHLCDYLQSPDCRLETLRLSYCRLTKASCSSLALALNSNPSHLTFLDLGWNKHLKDSGVEHLCAFLQNSHCRLETLRLNWCSVSEPGCAALASAKPFHLTYLDLGGNAQLNDAAVEQLCTFLQSPDCQLETIRLNSCSVSKSGCCALARALQSNPSHLEEVNLWYNHLDDSDVKALYDLKQNPRYRLDRVMR